MIDWVHPGAVLIAGSILIPFFKGRVKQAYLLLLPALAFLSVLNMSEGVYGAYHIMGQELIFGRVDKLSLVFSYIFSLTAFISMCYGLNLKEDGHHIAGFVYAGSAIGVALAGDFLTLVLFWEFMAFSSVFLILYRRTDAAYGAAFRYILVHIFGGVCLIGGAVMYYAQTQSFAFNPMELAGPGAALILIAFIINAAVPPLGAWLPDAYPEATISGAVFMSAFTTKSAVYALARGFAGTDILIVLGVIMAVYGVVYAVLENDIRRLLSYHIISQVGYMVAAVGIGTQMAINGAVAHAFAHILYKGLLFMGAGSIIYMTGKRKLSELGGLYKTMPYTFILYMVGAFAISSVPFFSGFVSKSVIVSAAAEEHLSYAWLFLTLASSGTFLSVGLKLPYLAFMAEDKKIKTEDPPLNMLIGMAMAAFMCVFIGLYPKFLYDMLPYPIHYASYTAEHLVWTFEILLFTWLGFYLYIKKLGTKPVVSLDTDWFYRKGALIFMWWDTNVIAPVDNAVGNSYKTLVLKFGNWLSGMSFKFDVEIVDGFVSAAKTLALRLSDRLCGMSFKFDVEVVDGLVNAAGKLMTGLSIVLRRIQTGLVHDYAVSVFVGLLVLLNLFFLLS